MTKPIILVKICYKLSYVIQGVKNIFDKATSWPLSQLISKFWLHLYFFAMLLLIGLALLPRVFLFIISLLLVNISLLCGRT